MGERKKKYFLAFLFLIYGFLFWPLFEKNHYSTPKIESNNIQKIKKISAIQEDIEKKEIAINSTQKKIPEIAHGKIETNILSEIPKESAPDILSMLQKKTFQKEDEEKILGELSKDEEGFLLLKWLLMNSHDPELVKLAIGGLAMVEKAESIELLLQQAWIYQKEPENSLYSFFLATISKIKGEYALSVLKKYIENQEFEPLRESMISALCSIGSPDALLYLEKVASAKDFPLLLSTIKNPQSSDFLVQKYFTTSNLDIRSATLSSLQNIGGNTPLISLANMIGSIQIPSQDILNQYVQDLYNENSFEWYKDYAKRGKNIQIQKSAIKCLQNAGEKAIPILNHLCNYNDSEIALLAESTKQKILNKLQK